MNPEAVLGDRHGTRTPSEQCGLIRDSDQYRSGWCESCAFHNWAGYIRNAYPRLSPSLCSRPVYGVFLFLPNGKLCRSFPVDSYSCNYYLDAQQPQLTPNFRPIHVLSANTHLPTRCSFRIVALERTIQNHSSSRAHRTGSATTYPLA
jgi:hypothetical protein